MSRLLTTGQMVDVIRIGEIGRTMDDENDIIRTDDGLFWINEDGEIEEEFSITDLVLDYKWELSKQKYASFTTAIQAYAEGKTIVYKHPDGEDFDRYFNRNGMGFKVRFEFGELANGKWEISDEY